MLEECYLKQCTHILVNYVADEEGLQGEISALLQRYPKLPSSDLIIVDDRVRIAVLFKVLVIRDFNFLIF